MDDFDEEGGRRRRRIRLNHFFLFFFDPTTQKKMDKQNMNEILCSRPLTEVFVQTALFNPNDLKTIAEMCKALWIECKFIEGEIPKYKRDERLKRGDVYVDDRREALTIITIFK